MASRWRLAVTESPRLVAASAAASLASTSFESIRSASSISPEAPRISPAELKNRDRASLAATERRVVLGPGLP